MTYITSRVGFLYNVATVMDLYSRKIVGLAMDEHMTTDLVSKALKQAILQRKPALGLIHHSDQGGQYTSNKFQELLVSYKITPSMSGTGNCFDHAAMESFFHMLKTEQVYFENTKPVKMPRRVFLIIF